MIQGAGRPIGDLGSSAYVSAQRKQYRPRFAQLFAFSPALVAWAKPLEDVCAVRSVLEAAMDAAEVIHPLAGEAFGGEACVADDALAVFVLEAWDGGSGRLLNLDPAQCGQRSSTYSPTERGAK